MRPKTNTVWIFLLLALLVAGLWALNTSSGPNVQTFDAHDHDRDGKPDHAAGAH